MKQQLRNGWQRNYNYANPPCIFILGCNTRAGLGLGLWPVAGNLWLGPVAGLGHGPVAGHLWLGPVARLGHGLGPVAWLEHGLGPVARLGLVAGLGLGVRCIGPWTQEIYLWVEAGNLGLGAHVHSVRPKSMSVSCR